MGWCNLVTENRHKDKIKLTVYKVTGEINTDDLSPAPDAWSRPHPSSCIGYV